MAPGISVRLSSLVSAVALVVAAAGEPIVDARQDLLLSGPQVVARHVAAIGGRAAFKAVRSVHARGRLEIRGAGVSGDFELLAARPNRLLYRATVPAIGVIEQGFDGKVGWTLNPVSGPELLTGQQLIEAADDAWFDHMLYEADRVRSLTTMERVDFDGRPAYKVRVALRSGVEPIEYFDVASGLAIGSEAVRVTPQGPVPTVTVLREYRRVGAVLQPTVLVQRALGVEQVVTIAEYELDRVMDSAFARPPAIAALVGR